MPVRADHHATVAEVLAWLSRRGTRKNRLGMAHFGIRSAKAFGVSMATMRPLLRRLGRDHDLALALWQTGWFEARILASFVDEPAKVTPRQMDRWAAAFDNWAVCDSTCFHLFDRTPHAWTKVRGWAGVVPSSYGERPLPRWPDSPSTIAPRPIDSSSRSCR